VSRNFRIARVFWPKRSFVIGSAVIVSSFNNKKVENESVVCRQTALVLKTLRWQTQHNDHDRPRKVDKVNTQDRDRCKDLEKGSSENYLGGEPLYHTLTISIQDKETSRHMSAKVMLWTSMYPIIIDLKSRVSVKIYFDICQYLVLIIYYISITIFDHYIYSYTIIYHC